ncbi:hypothetical protein LTR56_027036, partial [Elasticomyces elasticus]
MANGRTGAFSNTTDRTAAGYFDKHEPSRRTVYRDDEDVFGNETGHGIQYRTLSWPFVAALMLTEIVTYGTLSLPSSLAVVGIVPGTILIVFLGVFALYTSLVLVKFKLNHPE